MYSFGNEDYFSDVQETGDQILQIWNARVEEATQQYPQLRTIVLIRDMETLRFKVFEQPTVQFDTSEYEWTLNSRNNFVGHSRNSERHTFTWQPHGSQFTILRQVSASARSFQVKKPDALDPEQTLRTLGYSDSWVKFL